MSRHLFALALIASIALPGCDPLGDFDLFGPSPTGDLRVVTRTTGDPLPTAPYFTEADDLPTVGGRSLPSDSIAPNGHVLFEDLRAVNWTVTLSGVPGRCSIVNGSARRSVTVSDGETALVSFEIAC